MAKITKSAVVNTAQDDADCQRDKQKVRNKQWYNSFFYSIADTLKTVAAVLTPVGIGAILPTVIEKASTEGLIGALAAAPTTNLIIAGISLVATAAAIGVSYVSSHYYHAAALEQTEMNSKHTAKYIVKEMKQQNTCLTQDKYPQNCRVDKKMWVHVVRPQEQQIVVQLGNARSD